MRTKLTACVSTDVQASAHPSFATSTTWPGAGQACKACGTARKKPCMHVWTAVPVRLSGSFAPSVREQDAKGLDWRSACAHDTAPLVRCSGCTCKSVAWPPCTCRVARASLVVVRRTPGAPW